MKKEDICAQVELRGKGLVVDNGRLGAERILVLTHRPRAVGTQAAKLEARIGIELLRTEQRRHETLCRRSFRGRTPLLKGFLVVWFRRD